MKPPHFTVEEAIAQERLGSLYHTGKKEQSKDSIPAGPNCRVLGSLQTIIA
jgi:hypothetical protein